MTDTLGRTFVVGIPGELNEDERRQLDAAGVRWQGRYEVLREDWQADSDTTPWTTRQVVRVAAGDPESAARQVTDVLGRPASLDAA